MNYFQKVKYQYASVNGQKIFYRSAGNPENPTILLLHGFPSASHMFRDLIRELANDYYLIAPDYPGFGQSSSPATTDYDYTFDNLANTVAGFIDVLGLEKFNLYLHDIGGPIGFRIATQRPAAIQSLIIQNANAYNIGLGDSLAPLVAYIQSQNPETEAGARGFLSFEATRWQYTDGAENPENISPDGYTLDQLYLDRPGAHEHFLAIFRDYGSNMPLYEKWQAWFREWQPKTLVISGKNDKLFVAAGAEAYKTDIHDAEIKLLNGGHFALEEHYIQAAHLIKKFLSK